MAAHGPRRPPPGCLVFSASSRPATRAGAICPQLPIENCRSKGNAVDSRLRTGIAEAIGTMILVVGGAGTAILATGTFFPKGSVGILGVALAFGLSLLVAAYAIGSISGCHVNPAVTLGLWVIGKTKTKELPFYIVGQIVGGLFGALIIYIIAKGSDQLQCQGVGIRVQRLRDALARRLQAGCRDVGGGLLHRCVRLHHRLDQPAVH